MTTPLTMTEARNTLCTIPAQFLNDNCIQLAQLRLSDALWLATGHYNEDTDEAPSYVVKAVNDLASWLRWNLQ